MAGEVGQGAFFKDSWHCKTEVVGGVGGAKGDVISKLPTVNIDCIAMGDGGDVVDWANEAKKFDILKEVGTWLLTFLVLILIVECIRLEKIHHYIANFFLRQILVLARDCFVLSEVVASKKNFF